MKKIISTIVAGSMFLSSIANAVTWNSDYGVITELTPDHIAWLDEHRADSNSGILGGFLWVRVSDSNYTSVSLKDIQSSASKEEARQLVTTNVQANILNMMIDQLEDDLVVAEDRIEELSNNVDSALEMINSKIAMINNIQSELATMTQLRDNLQATVDGEDARQVEAIANAVAPLNIRIMELETSLANEEAALATANIRIAELNLEITTLTSRAEAAEMLNAQNAITIANHVSTIASKNAEIMTLNSQLLTATQALATAIQQRDDQIVETARIQGLLDTATTTIGVRDATISDLRSTLVASQAAERLAAAEVLRLIGVENTLRGQIATLTADLATERARVDEYRVSINGNVYTINSNASALIAVGVAITHGRSLVDTEAPADARGTAIATSINDMADFTASYDTITNAISVSYTGLGTADEYRVSINGTVYVVNSNSSALVVAGVAIAHGRSLVDITSDNAAVIATADRVLVDLAVSRSGSSYNLANAAAVINRYADDVNTFQSRWITARDNLTAMTTMYTDTRDNLRDVVAAVERIVGPGISTGALTPDNINARIIEVNTALARLQVIIDNTNQAPAILPTDGDNYVDPTTVDHVDRGTTPNQVGLTLLGVDGVQYNTNTGMIGREFTTSGGVTLQFGTYDLWTPAEQAEAIAAGWIYATSHHFDDIIEDAIDSAYTDGYDDGYRDGYEDGYQAGFDDGRVYERNL